MVDPKELSLEPWSLFGHLDILRTPLTDPWNSRTSKPSLKPEAWNLLEDPGNLSRLWTPSPGLMMTLAAVRSGGGREREPREHIRHSARYRQRPCNSVRWDRTRPEIRTLRLQNKSAGIHQVFYIQSPPLQNKSCGFRNLNVKPDVISLSAGAAWRV